MVRRCAQRAVSNHGGGFGPAAILRDALASLGLLRMRSACWEIQKSQDNGLVIPLAPTPQENPASMRICFLNQAPKKSAAYEAARIEAQLNSYSSPGTKVEIVFPDDYEGSQLYDTIGSQSILNGLHHM